MKLQKLGSSVVPGDDLVQLVYTLSILPNTLGYEANLTTTFYAAILDYGTYTTQYWSFNGTLNVVPTAIVPKPNTSPSQTQIYFGNFPAGTVSMQLGHFSWFSARLYINESFYSTFDLVVNLTNSQGLNTQISSVDFQVG